MNRGRPPGSRDLNERKDGMDELKKARGLELLRKLSESHGAPGCEDAVRRIFRLELGGEIFTDRSGNILCRRPGKSKTPRIMLTAHMDEVGLAVQAITRSGLIRFVPLGGWWAHTLPAKRVRILTREGREIVGVIGARPPHFLSEAERDKVLKFDDMFIDVGAESAQEVQERMGISIGDTIVPESAFTPMHNPDLLLCKAFDNRVGMALILQAAAELDQGLHPNCVFAVGTVQEEVGTRGAQTAAFSVNPDVAIVLEGAPADDLPGTPEDERQAVVGSGVQVRLMDPSAIMNRKLADYVVRTARDHEIPHQQAVRKSGGTDAKVIHLSGSGVPTIVLGVPARYIHSHNSIIHMSDYLATLELVSRLLHSLDSETVDGFTCFDD